MRPQQRPRLLCAVAAACALAAAPYPPPPGFASLLIGDADPRGRVLRPPNASLGTSGAIWDHGDCNLTYEQTFAERGTYALRSKWGEACNYTGRSYAKECRCDLWTKGGDGEHAFPLRPNRRYIVAAVVRAELDRLGVEVNLGVPQVLRLEGSSIGQHANGSRFGGLPASTRALRPNVDGWVRWEWEMVTPLRTDVRWGSLMLRVYVAQGVAMPSLSLADFAVIETPPAPPPRLAGAAALRFRGGAGALTMGMRVLSCGSDRILTTAAEYVIDAAGGTINVSQRVDMSRALGQWALSAPLTDLAVLETDPTLCVLGNSYVALGVQADGLLGIVPQQQRQGRGHRQQDYGQGQALTATLTNQFGGAFNRFAEGSLLSLDDWGGLTVTPALPRGSGLLPRATLLPNHEGQLPTFGALPRDDIETAVQLDGGWRAQWSIQAGTRLFSSVAPVRPFDWGGSFRFLWFECFSDAACRSMFTTGGTQAAEWASVDKVIMWTAADKQWGMCVGACLLPPSLLPPSQVEQSYIYILAQCETDTCPRSTFYQCIAGAGAGRFSHSQTPPPCGPSSGRCVPPTARH